MRPPLIPPNSGRILGNQLQTFYNLNPLNMKYFSDQEYTVFRGFTVYISTRLTTRKILCLAIFYFITEYL